MDEGVKIYDIRREGHGCDLCDEDAHLRVELVNAISGITFAFKIGPRCRLLLEGGLRAQRKWEVRGGKHA